MAVNIGHRSTYNYHIGNPIDMKVPNNVVENWYPKSASEEEYRILAKIDELSNHRDGVRIHLKNDMIIPSLYMTYDLDLVKSKKGRIHYKDNPDARYECNYRAKMRFESMKQRGLLCGDYHTNPAITIVGRQAIECKRDNDEHSITDIKNALCEIADILKKQSDISEDVIQKLVVLSNEIDNESSASKVMDISNTVCTTISTIPTVVQGVNLGIKYMPVIGELIGNLLKGVGVL